MPLAFKAIIFKRWIPVFASVALLFCTFTVHSRTAIQAQPLLSVPLTDLPREAQTTYQLIRKGGPFPYEKDGVVFGNREKILPQQARGYYREYTVKTPGARDRGAQRIVCGGEQAQMPQACYYTADHYASFRMVVNP